MRREGKPGPFIPSEVPAQTGPARVTTLAPARRRRRAIKAVGARAKRPRSGNSVYARAETLAPLRECMRAGDNTCARATTSAPVRQRVARGRGVFSQIQCSCDCVCVRATTPASGRQRLRPGDNVCARATTGALREGCFFTNTPNFNARATTSASGRQRLRPGDNVRMRTGDNVCARPTTSAPVRRRVPRGRGVFSQTPQTSTLGRRRLRPGDNGCARATTSGSYCCNVGIFFCFRNPNKTFPLSLFENYSNCVEDGNPKLFLLVGVFLSALNRDLAFLSRHLSI